MASLHQGPPENAPRPLLSRGTLPHNVIMQSLAHAFGLPHSGALQWVHNIATEAQLVAACADPAVHVLEANVYFDTTDATPLLKASRTAPAELDLPSFLTRAVLAQKAVKLDFHTPQAVEPTIALLALLRPELPPILHANVFALLSSPQAAESLEPEQFVRLVATRLPRALISLGWSLKRATDTDGRVEEALIMQLAAMLTERLGPTHYGLEIRAGYHPTRNGVAGERGAALLLDPLPTLPPAHSTESLGGNVVSLLPRLRRVA